MMLSVRTIPNNGELTAKIQSYEKEVKGFKMAISSSKQQAAQFDREELMNGGGFTTLTVKGTSLLFPILSNGDVK